MLARGLKRNDAQDRAVWRLRCKKTAHLHLQGKQDRFQGDEDVYQHSWNNDDTSTQMVI